MNDRYRLSMLFDFYGELLTDNQKKILDDFLNSDFTISEIAINKNISRQSIHDTIKRSEMILVEFEEKLQLVKKFSYVKEEILKAKNLLKEKDINSSKQELNQIIENLFNSF